MSGRLGSSSCQQEGVVSRIDAGGRAFVAVQRAEACQTCSSRPACVALGARTSEIQVEVSNDIGAGPGDRVGLALPERDIVTVSILVYLVPTLGLLVGALLGSNLSPDSSDSGNSVALLGAGVGLGLGLLASRVIGRILGAGRRYAPRLTRITARSNATGPEDPGPSELALR